MQLKDCYTGVYNSLCGDSAGNTMDKLINIAFKDQFYLRFKYKPQCSDHIAGHDSIERASSDVYVDPAKNKPESDYSQSNSASSSSYRICRQSVMLSHVVLSVLLLSLQRVFVSSWEWWNIQLHMYKVLHNLQIVTYMGFLSVQWISCFVPLSRG